MSHEQNIVRAIFESLEVHNSLHPDQPLACERATRLFGENAGLTSLAFVSLLLDIEERIERYLGCKVTLADDRAFSVRNSPFRDVDSLIEFIRGRLEPAVERVAQ